MPQNENAHKKKYRKQKEEADKQEDLLFKNQNIIIFIIAGTDRGTPKVFPVRKDIHEIWYVLYSSGSRQVFVHGDRDRSNSSDLFSALIL